MKYLQSRTLWTIVALFVYNGLVSVQGLLPAEYSLLVNAFLSAFAIYFRINPSVK